jgi:phosphatidylethanolamine/phosphatidyl-N-methylethanolamine N-methyltransferase
MSQRLKDYGVFWREFRSNFHSTGAVLPSGRLLARSLARFVGQADCGQRILEVGPGTGAVTARIVRQLRSGDQFDLVELNDQFVANLRDRFTADPAFKAVSHQARVLHQPVEQLQSEQPYDLIVSGLPLNNFSVEQVESILAVLRRLLRAGGTLSFFEYIAIRPLRAMVSGPQERARLRGISRSLAALLEPHEIRRDWIWPNVPPAWVHHVRLPAEASSG